MTTKLNKPIRRESEASIFDRGELRYVIVSIEPARGGASVGFRLKGTRDTFRLPVASLFVRAVEHHTYRIEREARRLHKLEKLPMRTARKRAARKLREDLR